MPNFRIFSHAAPTSGKRKGEIGVSLGKITVIVSAGISSINRTSSPMIRVVLELLVELPPVARHLSSNHKKTFSPMHRSLQSEPAAFLANVSKEI
jgi:hypothetical protein